MLAKTKKTLEWAIFSFLGLIVVVAGSLFFYQITYANKIYRNVFVADIDLSGKSKSQAGSLLGKKFDSLLNEEITIKSADKEIKLKVSDTGLTLDSNKIVADAYRIGRSDRFLVQLKNSAATLWRRTDILTESKIDPKKYDEFTKVAAAGLNSDPINANLLIENGQLKEVNEQDGIVADTADLTGKILQLSSDSSSKKIILPAQKTPASVKATDFQEAKNYAETALNKKIHLSYENNVYTPSRSEIGNWISFTSKDNKYYAELNESNIRAYLNKIAVDFEIIKKDRKINAADNSVIEEGQEGKLLDKNTIISQIKDQITGSTDIQIAMVTNPVAPGEVKIFPDVGVVAGRFEGKYIDIDLTTQKLCQIEGPNILGCTLISSGKKGFETPTGTFSVREKHPRHWSSKYNMYLPYWQRLTDSGYGLHELPETDTWKESPAHLGTPVSHGCVRLGVGPAQSIYDWAEVGTTVFIHK